MITNYKHRFEKDFQQKFLQSPQYKNNNNNNNNNIIITDESPTTPESPEEFLTELKRNISTENINTEHLTETLRTLRVSLSECPTSWAQRFGAEGLQCVLEILRAATTTTATTITTTEATTKSTTTTLRPTTTTTSDHTIQHECVRCVFAYLRRLGLKPILETQDGLVLLAKCICLVHPDTMLDVVKLMSCICLDHQDKVLDAMRANGDASGTRPFQAVIRTLTGSEFSMALKLACLQMINALIQRRDGELRFRIRQELIQDGLSDALPVLRNMQNKNIDKQLNIFDDARHCSVIDVGYCKLEFDEG